ncbi:uncharacterized protein H6S33_004514 [Morchella sextelata]|uniref:uncharacterized protein n=1 Tax=Morchella sextelata TaxID=1174677 RepID=UPI001D050226|nr:uncharacterized protein H6S33_004514 [Morchella sextelata]KAH0606057.1 hypothetical protein H6S33_004514 [Morchella sextelata]
MEYVECGDLSQYITDRKKALAGAKTITRQILEGLVILHGEGICHRDLKPQNILVASRIPLHIKIADFGTSKRAENTVLRTMLGTPAYSAPELTASSMSQFTNALDIWSLGILVHEVLTSKRPFFDQAAYDEDSGKISGVVSSSTTKPLTQANSPLLFGYYYGNIEFPVDDLVTSGASPEAICFVRGLLAANPEDRPAALEAFKDVWLHIDHPECTRMDDWLKSLESELSVLGIDLKLKED